MGHAVGVRAKKQSTLNSNLNDESNTMQVCVVKPTKDAYSEYPLAREW